MTDTAPDLSDFIEELQAAAHAAGDTPTPMVAGTFVMYPMDDGGIMAVLNVAEGPMAGERRLRMRPGMIRAAMALSGGGGKLGALKALTGRRRGQQ